MRAATLLGLAAGFVLTGSTSLWALDQQDLQALQQSNQCRGCDLSGASFGGWHLTELDLSGTNMSGADLRAAVLTEVTLDNGTLADADLSGASVQDCSLRGVNLSGTDLDGTVFVGSDLTDAQGLNQEQLDQACDDQRDGVTQLSNPFSLAACQ